jgi:hypothetical protein
MNCSGRTPNLEMVRKCFMVSPQERHTMVRSLSGTKDERSTARVETVSYGTRISTETGGSATGLSATNAWHGAAVGGYTYVRLISAVARSSFSQEALNLDSTKGGNVARARRLEELCSGRRISLGIEAASAAASISFFGATPPGCCRRRSCRCGDLPGYRRRPSGLGPAHAFRRAQAHWRGRKRPCRHRPAE